MENAWEHISWPKANSHLFLQCWRCQHQHHANSRLPSLDNMVKITPCTTLPSSACVLVWWLSSLLLILFKNILTMVENAAVIVISKLFEPVPFTLAKAHGQLKNASISRTSQWQGVRTFPPLIGQYIPYLHEKILTVPTSYYHFCSWIRTWTFAFSPSSAPRSGSSCLPYSCSDA